MTLGTLALVLVLLAAPAASFVIDELAVSTEGLPTGGTNPLGGDVTPPGAFPPRVGVLTHPSIQAVPDPASVTEAVWIVGLSCVAFLLASLSVLVWNRFQAHQTDVHVIGGSGALRKPFLVTVVTGSRPGAGFTKGTVSLTVIGNRGASRQLTIPAGDNLLFTRGAASRFLVQNAGSIGIPKSLGVELKDDNRGHKWYLAYVSITDLDHRVTWCFPCHRWLESLKGQPGRVTLMEGRSRKARLLADNIRRSLGERHTWLAPWSVGVVGHWAQRICCLIQVAWSVAVTICANLFIWADDQVDGKTSTLSLVALNLVVIGSLSLIQTGLSWVKSSPTGPLIMTLADGSDTDIDLLEAGLVKKDSNPEKENPEAVYACDIIDETRWMQTAMASVKIPARERRRACVIDVEGGLCPVLADHLAGRHLPWAIQVVVAGGLLCVTVLAAAYTLGHPAPPGQMWQVTCLGSLAFQAGLLEPIKCFILALFKASCHTPTLF